MILTTEIEINVNNKNIKYLKEQGINAKYGTKLLVPISAIKKYSRYRIEAQCENCNSINDVSMQKYSQNKDRGGRYLCKACNNITLRLSMMKKYGVDNSAKCPESIIKRKNTCLEKYGCEYVVNSVYSKDKTIKTNMERYGGHPMKIKEIGLKAGGKSRQAKIISGEIVPDEQIADWERYRRTVRRLTWRNKKKLFENWNGIDFYDFQNTELLSINLDISECPIALTLPENTFDSVTCCSNLCLYE